jgi:hypothetical protein
MTGLTFVAKELLKLLTNLSKVFHDFNDDFGNVNWLSFATWCCLDVVLYCLAEFFPIVLDIFPLQFQLCVA